MRRSLLALLLFAAACETRVSGIFIATRPAVHPNPPRTPAQVQLFTSGHPDVPYNELGVIEEQVTQYGRGDALALELAQLQADGAANGCDAVVVGGSQEEQFVNGKQGFGGFWGTCIVYNRTTAAK